MFIYFTHFVFNTTLYFDGTSFHSIPFTSPPHTPTVSWWIPPTPQRGPSSVNSLLDVLHPSTGRPSCRKVHLPCRAWPRDSTLGRATRPPWRPSGHPDLTHSFSRPPLFQHHPWVHPVKRENSVNERPSTPRSPGTLLLLSYLLTHESITLRPTSQSSSDLPCSHLRPSD